MALCGDDHGKVIARINRIEGQVRGLKKMVAEDRDCLQVLKQIAAASGAMRSLGGVILEDHLKGCVATAIQEQDNAADLITEVIDILKNSVSRFLEHDWTVCEIRSLSGTFTIEGFLHCFWCGCAGAAQLHYRLRQSSTKYAG